MYTYMYVSPSQHHRLRCAWAKFSCFRHALVDKHIDVRLRLRLFDAVVTPCALYGLTSAPLTATDEECLAITQRKMLRNIVGYVKLPDDTWADMYRRLRVKVERAVQHRPVHDWVETLCSNKLRLLTQIETGRRCALTCRVATWSPKDVADAKLHSRPARGRGRPRVTWQRPIA